MGDLLKSLNIEPMVLLLNGVVFLLLLAILNAIFWKPMMRHLEGRRHQIADAYKTVEETRREMENLRAEYQGRLAKIEADARGRIQQTVRDAQAQREQMIAEARGQAEQIMAEGARNIQHERDQTLAGMRDTLDDVALEVLTKATGMSGDGTRRKLVDEYIANNVLRS
jgi:F-type H+-transporting ATPase subunit b